MKTIFLNCTSRFKRWVPIVTVILLGTIGVPIYAQSPGGVSTNLQLWMKADQGLTGTNPVTSWADQSGNGFTATKVGSPKQNGLVNFNPKVSFGSGNYFQVPHNTLLNQNAQNKITVATVNISGATGYNGYFAKTQGSDWNAGWVLASNNNGDLLGFCTGDWSGGQPSNAAYSAFNASKPSISFGYSTAASGTNNYMAVDGQNATASTGNINTGTTTEPLTIGTAGGYAYVGDIAEAIMYNDDVSGSKNKIESYLAIKYGITLNKTSSPNYVSSNGTNVWTGASNTGYQNNIAGIGQDDASALYQKQSNSTNPGLQAVMGIGTSLANTNELNGNTFSADQSFIMWGDNGLSKSFATPITGIAGINNRLASIWKVQETGTVGTVTIAWPTSNATTILIVSNDATISSTDNILPTTSININGVNYQMATVDLSSGQFFTFAAFIAGPGGVGASLRVWMKANEGSVTTTDGSQVTSIANYGEVGGNLIGGTASASISGQNSSPLYVSNSMNFNPALQSTTTSGMGILNGLATVNDDVTAFSVHKNPDLASWRTLFNFQAGSNLSSTAYSTPDFAIYNGKIALYNGSGASGTYDYVANRPYITSIFYPNSGSITGATNGYSNATISTTPKGVNFNIGTDNDGVYDGVDISISETILYNRTLTATEAQRVNSYLAIKYGITLDQTTSTNYLNSTGGVVWDVSLAGTFKNNVAGIGRDDASALYQKQSNSINSGLQALMGIGTSLANTNDLNGNTFSADQSFIMWGDNGLSKSFATPITGIAGINNRLASIWKVQETGTVGTVAIAWPTSNTTTKLIVSNDATISSTDNILPTTSTNINGVNYQMATVDLSSGQFFTFAAFVTGPGGVDGAALWVKSDNISDINIGWDDNSSNSNLLEKTGTVTLNSADAAHNYHPFTSGYSSSNYFRDINNSINNGYQVYENSDLSLISVVRPTAVANGSITGLDYDDYAREPGFGVGSDGKVYKHSYSNNSTDVGTSGSYTANRSQLMYWTGTNGGAVTVGLNGVETTSANSAPLLTRGNMLSVGYGSAGISGAFPGQIMEVIWFKKALTQNERDRVNSYLAIKNGITLNSGNTNYLSSTSSPVWTASSNTGYKNNIAGIGRDDASGLNQKQSNSINSGTQVVIGNISIETDNASNSNNFSADQVYEMWGDNNLATTFTASYNGSANTRFARIWKIQETGTVGNVLVRIPTSVAANVKSLIIHTNPAFGTVDRAVPVTTVGSNYEATFNFNNGDYFTYSTTPACTAGTTVPTLSATTKTNSCPTPTADLTTITASNTPAGTVLQWHTATPATSANKVTTPSAVAAGTYYAVFYDATNTCYGGSPAGSATSSVTVTIVDCVADTDGDGTPDWSEPAGGSNDPCLPAKPAGYTGYNATNATWQAADCDGDGFTNGAEKTAGSDPYSAASTPTTDTDGDGTPDVSEPAGGSNNPCLPAKPAGYTGYNATNATWQAADCDGDGFTNGAEKTAGSDPYSAASTPTTDTDGDGTPDVSEPAGGSNDPCLPAKPAGYTGYNATNATWQAADCDNDGFTNGAEKTAGSDPYSAASTPTTDTDGDGTPDVSEPAGGSNDPCLPAKPAGYTGYVATNATWQAADCDNDGFTNGAEKTAGSDPYSAASTPTTDTDGDGTPDVSEPAGGSNNPCLPAKPAGYTGYNATNATWQAADCDNDGFTNGAEKTAGSDPYSAASTPTTDTDGDGTPDVSEPAGGSNDPCLPAKPAGYTGYNATNATWQAADCDGDGFTNGAEKTAGSDPYSAASTPTTDTDGDGTPDVSEPAGGSNNPCLPAKPAGYTGYNATNATWQAADCDGDGFTNGAEKTAGSDPYSAASTPTTDTDGDGTPDVSEPAGGSNDPCLPAKPAGYTGYNATNATWQAADCDNDGFTNGAEKTAGSDPYSAASTPTTDTDGDGTPDVSEPAGGSNDPCLPAKPAGYTGYNATNATWQAADCDNDGFTNGAEKTAGSDPYSAASTPTTDTDGDGTPDVSEPAGGSNNPCLPAKPAGYTGYVASNTTWANADCDGDGFSNGIEAGAGTDPYNAASKPTADADGDGTPDVSEPAGGSNDPCLPAKPAGYTGYNASNAIWAAADCDGDGFTNGTEAAAGSDPYSAASKPVDTDGDGIPDVNDTDVDGDGISNAVEEAACNPSSVTCDTDGDGLPNSKDMDSDNDGINDVMEASLTDANGDGKADGTVGTNGAITGTVTNYNALPNPDGDLLASPYDLDSDNTGLKDGPAAGIDPTLYDANGKLLSTTDPDQDGVMNSVDGLPNAWGDAQDTDGDGIPDATDTDLDGDGISNAVEEAACSPAIATCDTDGDGVPNTKDMDSDNDGINDVMEAGLTDANGDGKADGTIGANGAVVGTITNYNSLPNPDGDSQASPYDLDSDNTGLKDGPAAGLNPALFDANGKLLSTTDPDKDGVMSSVDGLPTQWGDAQDTDGDGIPDSADIDIDGDGIANTAEDTACNPVTSTCDSDGDGIPNSKDMDSDNDGINDAIEAGLTDANGDGKADGTIGANGAVPSAIATYNGLPNPDGDALANPYDLDSDNTGLKDGPAAGNDPALYDANGKLLSTADPDKDGVMSSVDGLPNTWGDDKDTDGDGIFDSLDADADGDGIASVVEDAACSPAVATCDTDGDGLPNSADMDSDNDGINDVIEAGLTDANGDGKADGTVGANGAIAGVITNYNSLPNPDGDVLPNPYDLDSDNTGLKDGPAAGLDPALFDANGKLLSTVDTDKDGVMASVDGLPTAWGDATDTDGDGVPDSTDADIDGDGIANAVEDAGCASPTATCDTDGDGIANRNDMDSDNDGINDVLEAGLTDANGDGKADGTIGANGSVPTAITNYSSLPNPDGDALANPYDLDSDNTGLKDGPASGLDPALFDANGKLLSTADPDKDGMVSSVDGLPNTWGDAADTDSDGVPDSIDTDVDGDGISNAAEEAACNPSTTTCDTDGDGVPNSKDMDSDNDGINDVIEAGLTDANGDGRADGTVGANGLIPTAITTYNGLPNPDGDALASPYDLDSDNTGLKDGPAAGNDPALYDANGKLLSTADPDKDGLMSSVDGLPTQWGDVTVIDTDGDGTPDSADTDDDNDGLADAQDKAPLDSDNDGIPNATDTDDDGDGILDTAEAAGQALDTDNDGIPNVTDTDDDNDGILDTAELGTLDANGKYTLPDVDGDGTPDLADALDTDGDGTPDAADTDDDNDGIADAQDKAPLDSDNDGIPNATDTDDDGDGILDTAEAAGKALDTDNDGTPNVTDTDDDNDGILDTVEVGTLDANGKYTLPDSDGDGLPDLADVATNALLNMKAFLQGAMNTAGTGMTNALSTQNLIPLTDPYGKGATTTSGTLTGNAVTDWVLVELRSTPASTTAPVESIAALLKNDGTIVNPDGSSPLKFATTSGNYYVSVRHRNHLGVMTASTISMSPTAFTIDFTNAATATYGSNAQATVGSLKAMRAGNATGLTITGTDNVRYSNGDINAITGYLTSQTGSPGGVKLGVYRNEDTNLDGNVRYSGATRDVLPVTNTILGHPNNPNSTTGFGFIVTQTF